MSTTKEKMEQLLLADEHSMIQLEDELHELKSCTHPNGTVKEEGLEPMEFGGQVCVDCNEKLLD